MRWEEVNLEESFIEKHTTRKWGTISRIEKTIELCKSSNYRYEVCKGYDDDLFYSVIWEAQEGFIKVEGHNKDGDFRALEFKDVKEWHQLYEVIGDVTFYYTFFVLYIKDYSVVINLKTLKFNLFTCQIIRPTDLLFHEDFYLKKKCRINCDYQEHIWIDNILYDIYLNQRLSLANLGLFEGKLLDTNDHYIAVNDRIGIHFYRIRLDRDGAYKAEKTPFIYSNCYPSDNPMLTIDDSPASCAPFSINEKRFWIDVECIKEVHARIKSREAHDDDPWSDYDLINDGLDGDADAYWNID